MAEGVSFVLAGTAATASTTHNTKRDLLWIYRVRLRSRVNWQLVQGSSSCLVNVRAPYSRRGMSTSYTWSERMGYRSIGRATTTTVLEIDPVSDEV
jgi:hypothetical protein